MTSEELNEIPRACDSAGPSLTDSPGVTVDNDDNDDKDGLPTDEARQSFGPPGGSISDILEKGDDIDFWGLEWVGGPIKVLATSKGNLAKVVVADLEGRAVLGAEGAAAATEVRGSLPAGRYLVKIFFSGRASAPLNYHVQSGAD